MDIYKLSGLIADLFVGECGTSGGEDEDHSEERTDSEVCGNLYPLLSEQNQLCTLWLTVASYLIQYSTCVSEMRNAMQTTPQILSSTCIQRRARVCLTAGRMYLDICNRCVYTLCRSFVCCVTDSLFSIQYVARNVRQLLSLLLGWNTLSF